MLSSGETEAKVAIQEEETMPLMEEESNLEKLGLNMPARVVTTSALWSILTCNMVSKNAAAGGSQAQHIASVVMAYWVVSISMVYLNKVLMTNQDFSIPAPLFVTWFQCLFTCGLLYLMGEVGERQRRKGKSASFTTQFPRMHYNMGIACKTGALSVVFVGMVTFNNLCLKYVEVSFYNVARSLTIVFNVILSFMILRSTVSSRTLLCLFLVFIGFYVGSDGEVNFSLIGTVSGVVSSLFVSLNSIYTKKVLPLVNDNQWTLTYVNNVNASMLFLPLVLLLEGSTVIQYAHQVFNPLFWAGMSLSGMLGFAIGIVTVMQIKATSPLTHNISGTAKAAVQSIMAFYIWGNPATTKGIMGIALVLLGSSLYTYVAISENEKKKALANADQPHGAGALPIHSPTVPLMKAGGTQ